MIQALFGRQRSTSDDDILVPYDKSALEDLPTAFIFVSSFSLCIADTHINLLQLPFDLPYSSRMFRVDEHCGILHCPWGAAFHLVMRPVGG